MGTRGWHGWFGSGILSAGTAATGWGYLAWDSLPGGPAGPPTPVTLALAGGVAPLAGLLIAVVRVRRAAAPAAGGDRLMKDRHEHRLASAVALARGWAFTSVVILGSLAAYAWVRVWRAFAGGLPEPAVAGVAVGLTAMVAGLVLLAVAMPDVTRRPSARGAAALAGGFVSVASVVLATLVAVTLLPVDAVTAARSGESAPVPTSVGKVGWRWQAPDGDRVREVARAGAGAVVRIGDGVVALDTRSGRERWHYRRPRAQTVQLFAAPDGSTVMVTFLPGGSTSGKKVRAVVLDAQTGEVRSEHSRTGGAGGRIWPVALSSRGLVAEGERGFVGRDLDTMETTWRYSAPEGCAVPRLRSHGALRDVFAVVTYCAEGLDEDGPDENTPMELTVVAVGLDPRDGSEVWRYEHKATTAPSRVEARASTDGGALSVGWTGAEGESDGVVLAQANGQVIGDHRGGFDPRYVVTGASTGPAAFNGFAAGGFLIPPDPGAERVDYRWRPFGAGGERKASLPRTERETPSRAALPLERALLTTSTSYRIDEAVPITVLVAPWDTEGTAKPVRITVEPDPVRGDGDSRPDSVQLRAAPGAILVVAIETPTVTGLV
ncbi:PQQ-binding-like beta-propeller repeat protein [Actinomadura sp. HBU206391]|uniref:outer membrane protein assembly factor BamB family protein n=1 Tax=Actinomadura sp. HBU206391 TaxID=2731692 RepID=UPI001650C5BC|nr:PQQ-binding-like beta-propeller repeat protein [Actinomadura sp. HBU206391]MBC6461252.1 hypothetical protein [Actinomadura sp. HBU206391]